MVPSRVVVIGGGFGGLYAARALEHDAAGNAAAPVGASLGAPVDRVGRVIVAPDLSIPGHPEIFAIADFGRLQVTGGIAWLFWLFLHILYLAEFRNQLSVLVEWGYSYFTYERGARLITARRSSSA